MIPLVDMRALPDTGKIQDCYDFVNEYHEFYIPIYNNRIDNITGIVSAHDLFDSDKNLPVSSIMHEPVFIPESRSISKLYRELYEKDLRVIFAVDEYGGVTGMATLYDIGEEIIGKIGDHEERTAAMKIREGEFLCDGDVEIDDLNDLLSIEIEQTDFTTLNGFMLKELGKIPAQGDAIDAQGYRFVVEKGSKRRAELIRVTKAM